MHKLCAKLAARMPINGAESSPVERQKFRIVPSKSQIDIIERSGLDGARRVGFRKDSLGDCFQSSRFGSRQSFR